MCFHFGVLFINLKLIKLKKKTKKLNTVQLNWKYDLILICIQGILRFMN